jgi:glycosyltransferase involved in cell wall biosynthesis
MTNPTYTLPLLATYPPSPLVSVVMTVLNPHPLFFPEAVRSILEQTLEDWELIIVEDPSSRCGRDLLDDISDPRIRYHRNSHRTSLVAQRNRGLSEARGEFMAVLDADDLADPTRLQRQVEYLQAHPKIGVVGSQVYAIDLDGKPTGYRSFPQDHDSILQALQCTVAICQGSAMFRTDLVREVGGYQFSEEGTVEDYDLLCRLVLHGVRLANLPLPLLHYRFHPEQMKVTRLRSTIRGILAVKKRYWLGQMSYSARLRMWAERLLLCIPPWLALSLITQMLYRDQSPADPLPLHLSEINGEPVPVQS